LWALAAYPTEIFIKENSIVYINHATNNPALATLYVVATCGAMLFSKVKVIVVVGVANLLILLVVSAVKEYAFTSLWCAYASIVSLLILVYFWKSSESRPHHYAAVV
jgi:general stress protein CsbA